MRITEEIEGMLARGATSDSNLLAVLHRVLEHFDCEVGTIHVLDPSSGTLKLRAHRGVPGTLLERVREIPKGKGMAGLAVERREPVEICNLRDDDSGIAEPGAKKTKMGGSIAVPMLLGDTVRGTVGIAKPASYEFTKEEKDLLLRIGTAIGQHLE